MSRALNIVLAQDQQRSDSMHFVEVEFDDGRSVRLGDWTDRPDGNHAIRVTAQDFARALAQEERTRSVDALTAYKSAALEVAAIDAEVARVHKEHTAWLAVLKGQRETAQRVVDVAELGFNPDQFVLARGILAIQWPKTPGQNQRLGDHPYTGPRRPIDSNMRDCLAEAREELRVGVGKMLHSYYGIKAYDGWASQRNDSEYGYGPRHGSIWFSIGLQRPVADRLRKGEPLTDEETIACVRWLEAIEENPELLG